nr:MAG TPA: hypothetical protein [Caudoviricetes sp.]
MINFRSFSSSICCSIVKNSCGFLFICILLK